ncbi:MAG TPA: pseudouridine synthase [bacterium]|nr:pseudouridine synthase [bacterium]
MIRLNKYIADSGICSRRKADELISDGKVRVNGLIVNALGIKINPDVDVIEVEGKEIQRPGDYVYYALYKPKGVISTASDDQGRQTVVDLVPKTPRVYPIGRLDEWSEGLIILTNDGGLTQQLSHPSFEHEKEYVVKVISSKLKVQSDIEKFIKNSFERGMLIDNKLMKADSVSNFQLSTGNSVLATFSVVLHTGYNRQIRKMCDKIGLEVNSLCRIRAGKLELAKLGLKPGEYAIIKREDIL